MFWWLRNKSGEKIAWLYKLVRIIFLNENVEKGIKSRRGHGYQLEAG